MSPLGPVFAFRSARLAFLSARLAIFVVFASCLARLTALTALGAPKAGASIDAHKSAAAVSSTRIVVRTFVLLRRLADASRATAPEARVR